MLLFSLGTSVSLPSPDVSASTAGSSTSQGVATLLSGTWVQVSSSDNITMSVVPVAGDGALVASKGTVNVKSNSTSGYQLYIAGTLYQSSDANRYAGLYLDGSTTGGSNAIINAVPTTATPSSLNINEWGYAIPGETGFSNQSLYDAAIAAESITASSTMDALTWRGLTADYIHLRTSTNDNSDSSLETTGEDTDIYYGVRINNTLSNGNYRNTIVYTAFIDGSSAIVMDPVRLDLTAADAGTDTTVNVLFKTGHESSSQPVTPSQIAVDLFDSANASAEVASCDASTIAISANHDGTYGHPLWFTCAVKRLAGAISSATPNYDVIVKVDSENNGIYTIYEEQDYWRFITQWNYSLTFNGNNATSGVPSNQTGTKLETESFSYTLPANPTRTYYTFNNWSDGSSTYTSGNTITLTKSSPSKTLTASWNEISVTYTLSYASGSHTISNSSSFPTQTAAQNRSTGTTYTFSIPSTTPTTADDYTFNCWSTDGTNCISGSTITLTSTSDSNTSVSQTLTALWTANGWTATINYDANGGSSAPTATTISGISNSTTSQSVTLSSTKASYSGHLFAGWATSSSATIAAYKAGETITVSKSSPTVTLYAVWDVMQGVSCSDFSSGTTYTVIDARFTTKNKYYAGKLSDGKCWMLQNLYIPNGTTLTSSTSNVSSNYSLPSSSTTWGESNSTAYYYAGTHLDATKDSSVYGGDTTNTGSYFSFIAATAGTGTGSSGDVSYSVCPKGWRLPTGGSSGEFQALYTAYSSNTGNFNTAFKFAATSHCSAYSCPSSSLTFGYYWSSTINSSAFAYYLFASASSTSHSYDFGKSYGRSVRCVLAS